MKRYLSGAVLVLLASAALVAQAPKGWKLRVDRSTSASDPDAAGTIKFVTMGTGFHATNPQAAVYWNPVNTASGTENGSAGSGETKRVWRSRGTGTAACTTTPCQLTGSSRSPAVSTPKRRFGAVGLQGPGGTLSGFSAKQSVW